MRLKPMTGLMQFINEPLTYQFMQRALLSALLVGILSGVIGTYVVVRGMSFFADALAHSVLPGVAVAYVLTAGASIGVFFGGLVFAVITALIIGWLTRDNRMKEDTAIGIVFAALFALGIAIISSSSYGRDLTHILFGNILGVRPEDLLVTALSAAAVLVVVVLFFKELAVISFDQNLARTLRLPAEGLRLLLLVLIAVTIIASLQIVGVALMLAMLIIPPATAQMFSTRLHHIMLRAALLGMVSSVVGVYVSYYLDIATGPSIVLTMTAVFIAAFVIKHFVPLIRVRPEKQAAHAGDETGKVG
jgi:manganese/iron transport system permease protein